MEKNLLIKCFFFTFVFCLFGCKFEVWRKKTHLILFQARFFFIIISFIFSYFLFLIWFFHFCNFFLLNFFYCISLSLFHLFPFLFYSFCVFTFFLFMFVSCAARRRRRSKFPNPDRGQKSSCSRGFVGGSPCMCEEIALDEETVRACVRACVRDTALFFLAFRPNLRRCADSPLTQPSDWSKWGHKSTGCCCEPPVGPVGRCLPWPPCPALPLPLPCPCPALFVTTDRHHHVCFNQDHM